MPSLLVVDDSATVRKMVIASLRPLQANFGEASSGLEAIEQLIVHSYDAVTLDLNMPDMHGLEFLHFVRSHQSMKHIPILVLTTQNDHELRREVMAAGADEYLTKPFTPESLLSAILRIIHQREIPTT